mmetsp:Transcript_6664/g.11807  ORF Transcript_6664/g.11807 Transcript_6664/m.11807 type:complete len:271 (-) Transcript_6664:505-1317(-)
MKKLCRFNMFPMADGIDPVNSFSTASKNSSCDSFVIEKGKVPLRLFFPTETLRKFVRTPNSSGTIPFRPLLEKFRWVNIGNAPSSDRGIVPVMLFLGKLIFKTSFLPLHLTPFSSSSCHSHSGSADKKPYCLVQDVGPPVAKYRTARAYLCFNVSTDTRDGKFCLSFFSHRNALLWGESGSCSASVPESSFATSIKASVPAVALATSDPRTERGIVTTTIIAQTTSTRHNAAHRGSFKDVHQFLVPCLSFRESVGVTTPSYTVSLLVGAE